MKITHILYSPDAPPSGGGTTPEPASTPTPDQAAGGPPGQKGEPGTPPPADDVADEYAELAKYTDAPPAKPAEKPPEEGTNKPPEGTKPPEPAKPKPPVKPSEDHDPDKLGVKELRAHYRTTRTRLKELESELAAVKAKPPEKPPEAKELEDLRTQLKDRDTRLKEIQDEIRLANFEKSEEYKTQVHEPYVRTCQAATTRATQMQVTNEDGSSRPMTEDEFWGIATERNADKQMEKAEALFGAGTAKSLRVVALADEVVKAFERMNDQKAQFKASIDTRQKEAAETQTRISKEASETFATAIAEAVEKHPSFFKPTDGDEEGNKALERGRALVDLVFNTANLTKEKFDLLPQHLQQKITAGQLDHVQMAKLHAVIANKAGAFDRLVHNLGKANARIAALEADLKKFQESTPGRGEPGGGTPAGDEDDADGMMADLKKYAR